MGVLKSPGTPFKACVRRALWR